MANDDRTTGNGSGVQRRHSHRRSGHPITGDAGRNTVRNLSDDPRPVVKVGTTQRRDTSNVPSKPGIGSHLAAVAWVGGLNLLEGARGIKDTLASGLLNPKKQVGKPRGTTRQRLAFLTAASLPVLTGVKVVPPVVEMFQQTPGENFTDRMYLDVGGHSPNEDIIGTRVGWAVDSFGPDGANVLSPEGIAKIERVAEDVRGINESNGEISPRDGYDQERSEVDAGFTALDRLADIIQTQGTDDRGVPLPFDYSDENQRKLAGLVLGYGQDVVDAGLTDEAMIKGSPDEVAARFASTGRGFESAEHLFDHGRNGPVPLVTPPVKAPGLERGGR